MEAELYMTRISRSEQELVATCVQAKTLAQLARTLGVSPGVARRRRDALYARLGVTSRQELFSLALQSGMIVVQVSVLLPTQLKE
jgi:DNA-binding CsgD family transcriptional regulator